MTARRALFLIAIAMTAHCAGSALAKPLSEKKLDAMRSRTIVVLYREASDLWFATPSQSFGTLPLVAVPFGGFFDIGISSARAMAAGRKLITEHAIDDPAIFLRNRLFEDLRSLPGFSDVRLMEEPQAGDLSLLQDFRPLAPEGSLVLDVRTTSWTLGFLGRKWQRYGLAHRVKARLIDPGRGWLIASATSTFIEKYKNPEDAPTLETLLADNAALLKLKLQQASWSALASLRAGLFPADVSKRLGEQDMKSFATRYTAAWCSHDPASVADFFSPNGSLKINDGAPSVGRAAIRDAAIGFYQTFPDLVVEMDAIEPHGDRWHYRWTLSGTNTAPDGTQHRVRISGYEDWKIGPDGLVAESLGHFDTDDYNRQLGK